MFLLPFVLSHTLRQSLSRYHLHATYRVTHLLRHRHHHHHHLEASAIVRLDTAKPYTHIIHRSASSSSISLTSQMHYYLSVCFMLTTILSLSLSRSHSLTHTVNTSCGAMVCLSLFPCDSSRYAFNSYSWFLCVSD